jgi:hypothetical protein
MMPSAAASVDFDGLWKTICFETLSLTTFSKKETVPC